MPGITCCRNPLIIIGFLVQFIVHQYRIPRIISTMDQSSEPRAYTWQWKKVDGSYDSWSDYDERYQTSIEAAFYSVRLGREQNPIIQLDNTTLNFMTQKEEGKDIKIRRSTLRNLLSLYQK